MMSRALAGLLLVVLLDSLLGCSSRYRDRDWATDPAAIDRATWGNICGGRAVMGEPTGPQQTGRSEDSWGGTSIEGVPVSCILVWEWDYRAMKPTTNLDAVIVSASKRTVIDRLTRELVEPLVPADLHKHLYLVLDRPFSTLAHKVPGFNLRGGWKDDPVSPEDRDYFLRVERDRKPPDQRAL